MSKRWGVRVLRRVSADMGFRTIAERTRLWLQAVIETAILSALLGGTNARRGSDGERTRRSSMTGYAA